MEEPICIVSRRDREVNARAGHARAWFGARTATRSALEEARGAWETPRSGKDRADRPSGRLRAARARSAQGEAEPFHGRGLQRHGAVLPGRLVGDGSARRAWHGERADGKRRNRLFVSANGNSPSSTKIPRRRDTVRREAGGRRHPSGTGSPRRASRRNSSSPRPKTEWTKRLCRVAGSVTTEWTDLLATAGSGQRPAPGPEPRTHPFGG